MRNVSGRFSGLEESTVCRASPLRVITSMLYSAKLFCYFELTADNMQIRRILIKLLLTSAGINIIKLVLLNRMSPISFHAFRS